MDALLVSSDAILVVIIFIWIVNTIILSFHLSQLFLCIDNIDNWNILNLNIAR